MTAATVEPGAEYRDDLDHIMRQLLFKGRWIPFVDNDDLDVLDLTPRKDQFRAEAQQAILVGQHQASDALAQDQFEVLSCDSSDRNRDRQ